MIIGITGGIGSGKSVVSRLIRTWGFNVYDCDYEARAIMDDNSELIEMISKEFGRDCLNDDASLNRRRLAFHIFNDPIKRNRLNAWVHALVRDDVIRKAGLSDNQLFFVESAILKTARLDSLCRAIWLVEALEDVRIKRVCSRSNLSESEVKQRIEAQRGEYENFNCQKVYKIFNSGEEPLIPTIERLVKLEVSIQFNKNE